MTTAHRPTWKAAVGRAAEGGFGGPSSAKSILDVAAHTKLKVRKGHQLTHTQAKREELLQKSLLKLQQAEAKLKLKVDPREIIPEMEKEGELRLLTQTADVEETKLLKYKDEDEDENEGEEDENNGLWSDSESDLDESDSDEESDDNDDDDDEDEEAALQAELAKIRAERTAAKAKQEEEVRSLFWNFFQILFVYTYERMYCGSQAAKEEEAKLEESALLGNPLLNTCGTTTGKLKRRWNDDVVFRNQAKEEPDRNKKRFINDTVRNDFHKRFLNKFIL